jgi:hypothetical protein
MSGPMAFLNADIYADDQWLDVIIKIQVDDEVMELRRSDRIPGTDDHDWIVTRGIDGTTPADHADGAEIVYLGWSGPIERPVVSGVGNKLRARIARMRGPGHGPRGFVG